MAVAGADKIVRVWNISKRKICLRIQLPSSVTSLYIWRKTLLCGQDEGGILIIGFGRKARRSPSSAVICKQMDADRASVRQIKTLADGVGYKSEHTLVYLSPIDIAARNRSKTPQVWKDVQTWQWIPEKRQLIFVLNNKRIKMFGLSNDKFILKKSLSCPLTEDCDSYDILDICSESGRILYQNPKLGITFYCPFMEEFLFKNQLAYDVEEEYSRGGIMIPNQCGLQDVILLESKMDGCLSLRQVNSNKEIDILKDSEDLVMPIRSSEGRLFKQFRIADTHLAFLWKGRGPHDFNPLDIDKDRNIGCDGVEVTYDTEDGICLFDTRNELEQLRKFMSFTRKWEIEYYPGQTKVSSFSVELLYGESPSDGVQTDRVNIQMLSFMNETLGSATRRFLYAFQVSFNKLHFHGKPLIGKHSFSRVCFWRRL